jgi:hypothetical protein
MPSATTAASSTSFPSEVATAPPRSALPVIAPAICTSCRRAKTASPCCTPTRSAPTRGQARHHRHPARIRRPQTPGQWPAPGPADRQRTLTAAGRISALGCVLRHLSRRPWLRLATEEFLGGDTSPLCRFSETRNLGAEQARRCSTAFAAKWITLSAEMPLDKGAAAR